MYNHSRSCLLARFRSLFAKSHRLLEDIHIILIWGFDYRSAVTFSILWITPPQRDKLWFQISLMLNSRYWYNRHWQIWRCWMCQPFPGGHINPAVTLAMATLGKCKWIQVPVYMIAQYFGGICGAALVNLAYIGNAFPQIIIPCSIFRIRADIHWRICLSEPAFVFL